jgi:uncharacterized protein (TIGR02217 family)
MGILTGRFPDDIAVGAEGGFPGWFLTIVQHAGGQETPHLDDPESLGRWNVARVVEVQGLHDAARRYFIRARASFHHFRFKDWKDYECARSGDDEGRLVGSGTLWTINKVYAAGDTFEYVRRLYRIVDGTDQIWRNGSLMVRNTDYTIDEDTGEVISAVEWDGDTLEVACEFDVLCRFDMDRMAARAEFRQPDEEAPSGATLHLSWPDIDIVEVREAEEEGDSSSS